MEMLSSCLSLVARSSRSCEGKAEMRERDASPRIGKDGATLGGTMRTDSGAAQRALTHVMPVTAVTLRKAW